MAEVYDVTVGGTGYMLRPGSYQRASAGPHDARVGRARLDAFAGGLRQAVQADKGRSWGGVGMVSSYEGQAVTAGPKRRDVTVTPTPALAPSDRKWSFTYRGVAYVVSGTGLYQVVTVGNLAAGYTFSDLTLKQTLAAPVVDAVLVGTKVYFAFGAGTNVASYDLATSTYVASPSINVAGVNTTRQARLLGVDGDTLVLVLAASANGVGYTGGIFNTDSDVLRLVTHDGHCWIICAVGIYRTKDPASTTAQTQAVAESSFAPLGYADDAVWAVSHLGQLYVWMGKSVQVYGKRADAVKNLDLDGGTRFHAAGLRGLSTSGACSVGTWLVVNLTNEYTGLVELWGFDGRGWWLLDASTGGADTYYWPVSLYGAADDADWLCGRGTLNQQASVWQLYRRASRPGLRSSSTLITPLLDGGARDVLKVWRRVGVEVALPEGGATSNAVTVTLEYSTDAGGTWTQALTQSLGASTRDVSLEAALSARPQAKRLQLRLSLAGVVDWAPQVVAVWAEYEQQEAPTRRRRWAFTVLCRDQVVKRDGSYDGTGARALALGLWNAWAAGATVTFKDVDFDLTGTTYTVRVAGLSEGLPKTAQAASNADSDLLVQLVEV